jgi:predicted RNase H-like HicB family nuclease
MALGTAESKRMRISASYRCHLAILHDEDGAFSAIVLNLPGAGSCGDTEEEAIANAHEAVTGVIQSYIDDGLEIPWQAPGSYSIPESATETWISVDA